MAHLTDNERTQLRRHVDHADNCLISFAIECPLCAAARKEILENAGYLLDDLDAAGESAKDLVAKLATAEAAQEKAEEEADRLSRENDHLDEQLDRHVDLDGRALANWALDAGAEVPDLKALAETIEVARVAQLARGGPACSSYEPKGKLDLCKCGRPPREHRREVIDA